MKNRSLRFSNMLSWITLAVSASFSLTSVLALIALVISTLALVTALDPPTHALRSVVLADDSYPKAVEGKPDVEWQIFQDDEYGLRLEYPADWSVQKVNIADSDDAAPVGRILSFAPQGWKGSVAPVALEIGLGSPEELERVWPGLMAAQSKTVTAVGYRALVWQSSSDEMFYVFEHPGASRLRVALRDSVDEEEIVNKMVDTLEFTLIHPLLPGLPRVP